MSKLNFLDENWTFAIVWWKTDEILKFDKKDSLGKWPREILCSACIYSNLLRSRLLLQICSFLLLSSSFCAAPNCSLCQLEYLIFWFWFGGGEGGVFVVKVMMSTLVMSRTKQLRMRCFDAPPSLEQIYKVFSNKASTHCSKSLYFVQKSICQFLVYESKSGILS